MQGLVSDNATSLTMGLGPLAEICHAFPNSTFPTAAIHEFFTENSEIATATSGFVAGVLTSLMSKSGQRGPRGAAMWIGTSRKLFPPALKNFGIEPDRFIFVDLKNEKDVLWAMDEALKCDALSAVVAEMPDLSFTESRRLQLAVEKSRTTGFVLRTNHKKISTTACVTRWKISPIKSELADDLPGVGFPQWKVDLLRVRNGKPGCWNMGWKNGKFELIESPDVISNEEQKRTEPTLGIAG